MVIPMPNCCLVSVPAVYENLFMCIEYFMSCEDNGWQSAVHYIFGLPAVIQKSMVSHHGETLPLEKYLHFVPWSCLHLWAMTKYTSPTKKACICRDKDAGMADADIKKYSLHCTTIKCIVNWYAKSEDFHHTGQKAGQKWIFTTCNTHYAICALASGNAHDVADLHQQNSTFHVQSFGRSHKQSSFYTQTRYVKGLFLVQRRSGEILGKVYRPVFLSVFCTGL